MIPVAYLLKFDSQRLEQTKIEATLFDDNGKPTSWAIRKSGTCFSKITNEFHYEPLPSSRDEDFFNEFRFNSEREALICWNNREINT